MKIDRITVNVRYSQGLAKGSFKTVELGAEGTLTPEEDYHEAQLSLYHELGETMKYVFASTSAGKVQNGAESHLPPLVSSSPPPRPEHWCEVHHCDFKRYERNGQVWYSHKAGTSWCREP